MIHPAQFYSFKGHPISMARAREAVAIPVYLFAIHFLSPGLGSKIERQVCLDEGSICYLTYPSPFPSVMEAVIVYVF